MNGPLSKKQQTNRISSIVAALCLILAMTTLTWGQTSSREARSGRSTTRRTTPQVYVQLPQPQAVGAVTLERALQKLNTIEAMSPLPLTGAAIGQLAWSAVSALDSATLAEQWLNREEVSEESLQLYFATFEGLFQYIRNGHRLQQMAMGDSRTLLTLAPDGLGLPINHGAAIIIADTNRRPTGRRGALVQQQTLLKVGEIAQTLRLQAAGLGLASLPLQPLDETAVRQALDFPRTTVPLYVLLVGYPPNSSGISINTMNPVAPPQPDQSKPIVLVVSPEEFQDQELQMTQQTLSNAGVQSVIASTRLGPVHGVLGQTAYATMLLDRIKTDNIRGLVFIGGPGAVQLAENKTAHTIAAEVVGQGKILGALSAGVPVLAKAGLLKQVRVTGHASDQQQLIQAGAIFSGAMVERDGLFFTAVGPASAQLFAQSMASALKTMP